MVLHKICSSPDRLRLRRGTQGQTVREIEAVREGDGVSLTIKHLGDQQVNADLDSDEAAALGDWLMLVPDSHLYPREQGEVG